jgi:O-antigen/teichoic acid export membrane protein
MLARRDFYWGYAAQGMNIGLGLIMMPIVVRYMSTVDVGLWFVFTTMASLAQLLELGFQPTLSRNVAYVYAGVQKLTAFGLQEIDNSTFNVALLGNLVAVSRWIYRWISFSAALVLLVGGTFYINTLLPKHSDFLAVYAGWFTFVLGNIINFYYGYLNAMLMGRGDVTAANKVVIASRSVQVLVGAGMVIAGFGLLGLGLASLLSTIISRILARRYVFSQHHPEMNNLVSNADEARDLVKVIWYNASRFGIVLIGVFLIWRANTLIAASRLGLADAASYGLAIQVFFLLNTIATVPFNLTLPHLNALRAQGKQEQVYQSFSTLLITALLIYSIVSLMILLYGNFFLSLIGSSTKLPNTLVLSGMVVVFLLEINHGTCANFITTGNHIPFIKASILTGICIVTVSIVFAPIFGIAGLVMAQGLVQVIYNNWKWPKEVGKIFNVSYFKIITDGFMFLIKCRKNIT